MRKNVNKGLDDAKDYLSMVEKIIEEAKNDYKEMFDIFIDHTPYNSIFSKMSTWIYLFSEDNAWKTYITTRDAAERCYPYNPNAKITSTIHIELLHDLMDRFARGSSIRNIENTMIRYHIAPSDVRFILDEFIKDGIVRSEINSKGTARYYLNGLYGDLFSKAIRNEYDAYLVDVIGDYENYHNYRDVMRRYHSVFSLNEEKENDDENIDVSSVLHEISSNYSGSSLESEENPDEDNGSAQNDDNHS